nr:reverse transcriptase domain-containing protein [Tanacetum cinerariifolium]
LPADALPTALSPGYVVDSNPEKDGKDLKEDPAFYPADRGNNDDDESSNDDDDDDDVEKDEEDKEEEEHLAPADPSDVSTDDLSVMIFPWMKSHILFIPCDLQETMTTVNQGMSVEEIERVVAQRVANAIEAIAIYEAKTNLARKSMSQTKQQKEKVVEYASNKRKWEGNHYGSSNQQNKGHKVPRAYKAWPINKKACAGSLPLCNQCRFHHSRPCTVKWGNYKKVGHIIQNCRTPATAKNQRTRTCYECGSLRHYKRHKVPRVHTAWPINKKAHAGSLPLCDQYKFPHNGTCTVKCGNYKKVGHIIQNFRTPATAKNERTRTCYECGSLRHYKSKYPIVKFHKHVDMIHGRVRASKPKTMQDEIEITTKLRNKKISTLAECQTENKKRLDNTSKNNQNQQQPNKRMLGLLTHVNTKETKDKSKEKRLEDALIVRDFPEVIPEDFSGISTDSTSGNSKSIRYLELHP